MPPALFDHLVSRIATLQRRQSVSMALLSPRTASDQVGRPQPWKGQSNVSNKLRLLVTLGMLACAIFGARTIVFAAPSTSIEITDVYNAVTTGDEWFQLYNMTKSAVTLDGWKVCNSDTCAAIPTTKIDPFSLAKIKATSVSGWPDKGLNGSADLLGLLDDKGSAVDSMNWGTPDPNWKNYNTFKDMLWNPGIKAPDANSNQ